VRLTVFTVEVGAARISAHHAKQRQRLDQWPAVFVACPIVLVRCRNGTVGGLRPDELASSAQCPALKALNPGHNAPRVRLFTLTQDRCQHAVHGTT
jgi:hypothetical protein